MGDSTHTYYKNCMIEGNTDYIFGSGNAVFDGCELNFVVTVILLWVVILLPAGLTIRLIM